MNLDEVLDGLEVDYRIGIATAPLYENHQHLFENVTATMADVDYISSRLCSCEAQIEDIKSKFTSDLLDAIAQKFRDYFESQPEPVSDEEFYADLQMLLYGGV